MEKHTDQNTQLLIVVPERQAHWKLQEAERSKSLSELNIEPHDTDCIPDKKSKPSPKLYNVILLAGSLSIFVVLLWLFLPHWNENTTVYDYKMLHITLEDFIGLDCYDNFYEKDFYCHLENSNSSSNLPTCNSSSKNITWNQIQSVTNHLKTREDALFVDDLIKISWMSVGTLQGDNNVIAVDNTNLEFRLLKMIKCIGKTQARVILVEGILTKTIRSRSSSKLVKQGGKSAGVQEAQVDSRNIQPDFHPINNDLGDLEWTPCTLNDTVIYCKGIPSTFPYSGYKSYKGPSRDSQTGGSTCGMYDQISLKSIENIILTSGKMAKDIEENDNLVKKEIIKLIMGLFEMPLFKKEFAIVTNYEDKLYGQDESPKPELLTKFHFTTDSATYKTYQLREAIRGLFGIDS